MNIIFLINEIVKYVCLLSVSWEIQSNGTDAFSDKATSLEYEAVDELLGYVELKNTVRGSSQVFQKECLQHDEAGLSSIFDKVLNNEISQLQPSQSEFPHLDVMCERDISRTSSMESLHEPNMSRKSSTESLDVMAMDEFDNFPVYCMQVGTVAKQPLVKTGKSCGEWGMEPQGDNTMVTPPRKLKKSVSMKKEPVVERGAGGMMKRSLVYNRAYKRVRSEELKKGSIKEQAKKVASEKARNAAKLFLETGCDMD